MDDLAAELHAGEYPISGTGLLAKRAMMTTKDHDLIGDFIVDDVPLAPETHVQEADSFPMAAASAAYVFSILEDVGNAVVEIIYPGSIRTRSAWHRGVFGDANLAVKAELNRARDGFAAPFKVPRGKIPVLSTKRLVWLKKCRNDYAHDLDVNVDFNKFFQYVLVMVAQINFIVMPTREIKAYPYEDHHDQFV
jgi:hypothetical protein